MTASADRPTSLFRLALPGIVLFLLLQVVVSAGVWFTGFGEFSGPDSYMRLVRTLECRGGFACPGGLLTHSNVPFGEVLHWPFLFDRILLLLATPFLPFTDLPHAVVLAGYLVGPLLGVAALLTFTAAARVILPDPVARWAPILAAGLFWVLFAFAPVRPDHHGLQTLLFLVALLGVLRILVTGEVRTFSWIAGTAMGLAIWISTEGVISTAPLLGSLAVAWVIRGGEDLTRGSARVWTAIAATLFLGLVLDAPEPDRWAIEFDRFSIAHLTAFTIGAGFWVSLVRRTPERVGGRATAILAASLVFGPFLVWSFPGLERGPLAEIQPELWPLFLDHVSEYTPAWRLGWETWGVMAMGPGLAGLLVAGFLGVSGRSTDGNGNALPHPRVGAGWMLVAVALTWLLGLSVFAQVRWSHYVHVLAPFGLAWLLGRALWGANRMDSPGLIKAGAKVGAVLLFMGWPMALLAFPSREDGGVGKAAACRPGPILTQVEGFRGKEGPRPRVMAPLFWGPELVFRGGVDVMAGPYHRNAAGILDSYRVMSATDPEEAHRVLQERGIDLVAFCVTEDFKPQVSRDSPGTLYGALVEDHPPPWLRSVPLPSAPEQYRLYEVLGGPSNTAGPGR